MILFMSIAQNKKLRFWAGGNETQALKTRTSAIQLSAMTNESLGSTRLQMKVTDIKYPLAIFSPWPERWDTVINHRLFNPF